MKKKAFKGSTMLNPVPVVLVSSRNRDGVHNVFTVAWTGIISSTPPLLYIAVKPERLSYENIKSTREFVINMPSKDIVKSLDYCGVRSGRTNDKIKECNFTMKDSKKIKTKYIDECPVTLECKVRDIIKFNSSHDMFVAEIISTNVNEELIDKNEKIHFDWANLIAYSHGEYFQMNKLRLGSFGFSVGKRKIAVRKKDKILEKPKNLDMNKSKSENKTSTSVKSKSSNKNYSKSISKPSSKIVSKSDNKEKINTFSKEKSEAKRMIKEFTKKK
ncbi:flavin reductase family protein [Fusobacterium sp. PH5-44]|uniref:flavin reductase family protein n=1 Tax=unclassified Fusobacterium TaxID=2648384 RepID=UPI003D1CCB6F